MNKYASIETDIFSVFDSASWKLENIKTLPDNFTQTGNIKEFIRLSIIPSSTEQKNIVRGILNIDIFIEAGLGSSRAMIIADKLDKYLAEKVLSTTLNGTTQFFTSSLATSGTDAVNKALYRHKYVIPFNYFGVL